MGCLNNFVEWDKLYYSGDLEPGDIIEFSRLTYSHYGFYIGDQICVHVTGPDNGMSASSAASSGRFKKGMKEAQYLSEIAKAGGSNSLKRKVRVNNCVMFENTLNLSRRDVSDAVEVALNGLERDGQGNVILESPIPYDYNLVGNNCECFVTRCRFEGGGFSIQATNPVMHTFSMGTVERFTSALRTEIADELDDDDNGVVEKVAFGATYAVTTAVGWSAYAAKTGTDAIVGGTVAVVDAVSDFLDSIFD